MDSQIGKMRGGKDEIVTVPGAEEPLHKPSGGNKDGKAEKAKDSGAEWLEKLTDELTQSPVAANVSFGFILMAIERLLEMQFECPCKSAARNGLSAAFFFVVPASIAFLLMLAMKIRTCMCGDPASMFRHALQSVVPAVLWLVLLFLDGRYLACAMTDWEGRFVELEGSAPQKWCEPFENATCIYRRNRPGTRQQCMLKSQGFTVTSQWIGIILLAVIALALLEYIIGKHFRKHYREEYGPLVRNTEAGKTETTKQENVQMDAVE